MLVRGGFDLVVSTCPYLPDEAVVLAAARMDLSAPVNAALSALVADLAAGRRPREAFRDQPERLLATVAAWPSPVAPGEDAKP